MATYQDFPVLIHSSTSLVGERSDGKKYYIVGALNKSASSAQEVENAQGVSFLNVPINACLSVPGAGIPVDNFACGGSDIQVLYYIK